MGLKMKMPNDLAAQETSHDRALSLADLLGCRSDRSVNLIQQALDEEYNLAIRDAAQMVREEGRKWAAK
jgi:hypothetical protein